MADTEYTRMHSLVRDLMGALQDVMPHLENGRSAQERELGAEVRNLIRQAQREVAALPSASLGEQREPSEDSKAEAITAALMRFAGYKKDEARACSRLILSRAYAEAASPASKSAGGLSADQQKKE